MLLTIFCCPPPPAHSLTGPFFCLSLAFFSRPQSDWARGLASMFQYESNRKDGSTNAVVCVCARSHRLRSVGIKLIKLHLVFNFNSVVVSYGYEWEIIVFIETIGMNCMRKCRNIIVRIKKIVSKPSSSPSSSSCISRNRRIHLFRISSPPSISRLSRFAFR